MASTTSCTARSRQNPSSRRAASSAPLATRPSPDQRRAHGAAGRSAQGEQLEPRALLGFEQPRQDAGREGGMAAASLTGDGDFGERGDADFYAAAIPSGQSREDPTGKPLK
jgi:hypothetical protein